MSLSNCDASGWRSLASAGSNRRRSCALRITPRLRCARSTHGASQAVGDARGSERAGVNRQNQITKRTPEGVRFSFKLKLVASACSRQRPKRARVHLDGHSQIIQIWASMGFLGLCMGDEKGTPLDSHGSRGNDEPNPRHEPLVWGMGAISPPCPKEEQPLPTKRGACPAEPGGQGVGRIRMCFLGEHSSRDARYSINARTPARDRRRAHYIRFSCPTRRRDRATCRSSLPIG